MADSILINAAGASPQDIRSKTVGGQEQQTVGIGNLAGEGVGAATDSEATGDGSLIAIIKRLRTVLSRQYASTPSAPSSVTVNASSALVIASNSSRKGLALINVSSSGQRISLHLNNGTAVLDDGYTLWPGDVWEMDERTFTTAQINGIASAASGKLAIQETT